MRLGQLSRKINISYSEVLNYLEDELGVHIDASLNSKIDDNHVTAIVEHFKPKKVDAPELIEEISTDELMDKTTIEDTIENENNVDELVDDAQTIVEELIEEKNIETIKAKAERLEGLKVIGKIDLPPPPPPEMVEIDGVMYDKAELKRQKREEKEERRLDAIKRRDERKRIAELKEIEQLKSDIISVEAKSVKKEESFEKKRLKEEKDLKRRKEVEERARREKQRKHYNEKHKVPVDAIKKKKGIKKEEIKEEILVDSELDPSSVFGKFWKWLTTF